MKSPFPSPSFRWPDHSPYCPGRPGYKGVCDCGAKRPPFKAEVHIEVLPDEHPGSPIQAVAELLASIPQLRRDRDELLAALEEIIAWGQPLARHRELLARIKGGG